MFIKFKIYFLVLSALFLMPFNVCASQELSAEEAIRATEELYAQQSYTNYYMYRKPYRNLSKPKNSRIDLNADIDDVTGFSDTRIKDLKVGVDYKISEDKTLGVAVSREIPDFQDASSWDRDVNAEEALAAKYKLKF